MEVARVATFTHSSPCSMIFLRASIWPWMRLMCARVSFRRSALWCMGGLYHTPYPMHAIIYGPPLWIPCKDNETAPITSRMVTPPNSATKTPTSTAGDQCTNSPEKRPPTFLANKMPTNLSSRYHGVLAGTQTRLTPLTSDFRSSVESFPEKAEPARISFLHAGPWAPPAVMPQSRPRLPPGPL